MFLIRFFIQFPILLFSITVHEFAHGYVAYKKGDDTAKIYGRLTLNPLAHIDPIGTLLLPIIAMLSGAPLFGWAKPVPVNPLRLTRKDMLFVGLAGPLANILLAVACSFIVWFFRSFHIDGIFRLMFTYGVIINIVLAIFNLIPVPPLDGSRIIAGLLPEELAYKYESITPYGFFIIIVLFASGLLWGIIGPIVRFLISWFLGGGYFG